MHLKNKIDNIRPAKKTYVIKKNNDTNMLKFISKLYFWLNV